MPWDKATPPLLVKGVFHPCELLHGSEGASAYAKVLFAFADGEYPEWTNDGQYTQISGDSPPWNKVFDDLEKP